jgi:drug/metabolite transporter superfamily protein YnfA
MRPGRSVLSPQRRDLHTGAGSSTTLALLSATVAMPLVLLAAFVPAVLVLPLFGMTAVVYAAIFAAIAWWHNDVRDADGVTWWDVAGAFAFIGFAAVLLSKPQEVLLLLGMH